MEKMEPALGFCDIFFSPDFFEENLKLSKADTVDRNFCMGDDLEDEQKSEDACPVVPVSPRNSVSSKRGSDASPFLGLPNESSSVPTGPVTRVKRESMSSEVSSHGSEIDCKEDRVSGQSEALMKAMAINKTLSESNADFSLDLTPFETPLQTCTAEEEEERKMAKLEKNRKSARECRKRKKEYVKGLESRLETCNRINKTLQKKIEDLENSNSKLMKELRQLKRSLKS